MARTDTLGHFLTDVADAIRTKTGSSATIQASSFDTAISNISGGGLDWSAIGYSGEPQDIIDGYNYAKTIYDNWDSTLTSMNAKYDKNNNLVFMPLVNTSNITDMYAAFRQCYRLITIPLLNTSNVSEFRYIFKGCYALANIPQFNISSASRLENMFTDCYSLTDTSLDNILKMCISNSSYSRTKTLASLGFASANYPSSRIQALPSYQDFINAGWTIGY